MIGNYSKNYGKNYESSKVYEEEIKNISFDDDINQLNDIQFKRLIDSGVRNNILLGKKCEGLIYHSYGFVKLDAPDLIKNGKFVELFINLAKEMNEGSDIDFEKEINEAPNNDLLGFLLWIKDELEAIAKIETEYLNSTPDADLINAGVRELDELGEFNIIDTLAGGDILKHDEVLKLPYHKVFDKLRKQTIENKISKNLAKIQQQKMKRKKN